MVTVVNVQSGLWNATNTYYASVRWSDGVIHYYWVDTLQDSYDKKDELQVLYPVGSEPRANWPLNAGITKIVFRKEVLNALPDKKVETVFYSLGDLTNLVVSEHGTWNSWVGNRSYNPLTNITENVMYWIQWPNTSTLDLTIMPPPGPEPPPPPEPEPPTPPPPIPEDVDFWTDPLGWISNAIVGGFENFINWFGNTFQSWTIGITSWLTSYAVEIYNILATGLSDTQTWVVGIIPTIQQWGTDITAGINQWWSSTSVTVHEWIIGATAGVVLWIDQQFNNIGEWWNNTSISVQSWIDDAAGAIGDFTAIFTLMIGEWWNTTTTTVQGWISGAVEGVNDWIDGTVANIGEWWDKTSLLVSATINASIAASTSWWTDAMQGFSDWIGGLGQSIADYIGEQVIGVQNWIKTELPNWVNDMFGGIFDEGGLFGKLVGFIQSIANIFSGIYPESEEVKQAKQDILDQKEEIDNLTEGL